MGKKLLLVSADKDFIARVDANSKNALIITQDETYREIDNYVSLIAILDLATIDVTEKLLKRIKQETVYIVVYTDNMDSLGILEDIASDVWIKPLPTGLLTKRLETLDKIFDVYTEKSEYMSQLNYSIRTYLSILNTSLYLVDKGLEKAWSDEKLLKYLNRMRNEQRRIGDAVWNYLEYARIEAGQIRFIPTATPISDIVKEFKNFVDGIQAGNEKPCELEIQIQDDLPLVYVDSIQTMSVFNKLVHYACDYSQDPHLKLHIKSEGEFIKMKIFTQTYHSSNFLSAFPYPLGQILQYVIEAQDGTIDLEVDKDKNSIFNLTLPIAEEE